MDRRAATRDRDGEKFVKFTIHTHTNTLTSRQINRLTTGKSSSTVKNTRVWKLKGQPPWPPHAAPTHTTAHSTHAHTSTNRARPLHRSPRRPNPILPHMRHSTHWVSARPIRVTQLPSGSLHGSSEPPQRPSGRLNRLIRADTNCPRGSSTRHKPRTSVNDGQATWSEHTGGASPADFAAHGDQSKGWGGGGDGEEGGLGQQGGGGVGGARGRRKKKEGERGTRGERRGKGKGKGHGREGREAAPTGAPDAMHALREGSRDGGRP